MPDRCRHRTTYIVRWITFLIQSAPLACFLGLRPNVRSWGATRALACLDVCACAACLRSGTRCGAPSTHRNITNMSWNYKKFHGNFRIFPDILEISRKYYQKAQGGSSARTHFHKSSQVNPYTRKTRHSPHRTPAMRIGSLALKICRAGGWIKKVIQRTI